MPWGIKTPDLKNNPLYLEPRVTAAESELAQIATSVKAFGAKGDGASIDSTAIINTLNSASTGTIKKVKIPDGIYKIDQTIIIPRGVHLELGQNTVIKATTGNFNIFQLRPEARLSGGTVDLQDITFTKAVFYLDAADIFQFYGQTHTISDMNILNKVPSTAGAFTGTGILCEAKTAGAFIDNVKFNNLTFINFDKVIHLRVDPVLDTLYASNNSNMAWVNANYFFQITAQNFKYGIYLEGKGGVPRDVAGNMFDQCQFQAEATTEAIVYCESAYNTFNIFMWDIHKMNDSKPAVNFTQGSKFNRIYTAMSLEITESWSDKGYMNEIGSAGNYVTNQRTLANRISTPYKGQFNGNQDDYLINGDKRGYTVTQTMGTPNTGTLTDIFLPDTEQGATWDMTGTDYDNPIQIVIDCTTDPAIYAQFIGTIHPWGAMPKGLKIEGWTGTQWLWLHEIKGNTSNDFLISPPYSTVDFLYKIRISFYGAVATNNKVTISRVVAISSKNLGKAYIPQFTNKIPMVDANGVVRNITLNTDGTWSNSGVVAPDMPPVMPNDKTMIGEQDDILLNATKRFTVTNLGAAITSGSLPWMFSLRKEQKCSWTNPTLAAPAIIEIDCSSKPLSFVESIGLGFAWGETPQNIKIEWVTTSGGSYVQKYLGSALNQSVVHIAARTGSVYKLKFTIWGANNANTLVRCNRIFATCADDYPKSFVNTESDNTMFGDLIIGDSTKGLQLKSPDGSYWKASISNTGTITWTKQ
ncbi:hypothetical protein J7E63_12845 [Bacillus sp. ISL-75]|uniref:glycoside hydrolase family 55 protein n=1 Tax=Bacillus sp. ISL-75 TaxID=2819137 RepID=UPI001BE61768|nr:glycoside hydrolase family 55 protein [Bacillus sp. ISL-75]MBT2727826.1 hypothetical protein [Bacillus sp. ISL-75]